MADTISIMKEDVKINEAIGDLGANHIDKNQDYKLPIVVLTHCNTGSLATAGYGTALGKLVIIYGNSINNLIKIPRCYSKFA